MNPLNLRATIGPRGTKTLLFAALSCPLLTWGLVSPTRRNRLITKVSTCK